MATCSNCQRNALFNYSPIQGVSEYYCGYHLPSFLKQPKNAHLVVNLEPVSDIPEAAYSVEAAAPEVVEEEPAAPKPRAPRKAKAAAAEEPAVPADEPVVEEAPAEEVAAEPAVEEPAAE